MPELYTIGHSTHTLKEFFALLQVHEITYLVDIRTVPKSRHVPWFNKNDLSTALHTEKIAYIHMPELGGLRHSHKDSINQGWHCEGLDHCNPLKACFLKHFLNEIIFGKRIRGAIKFKGLSQIQF